MASTDLTSIEDVKLQANIPDNNDNLWLASAISSVSSIMETATRRWLAPRGTLTRYFDGVLVRTPDSRGTPTRYSGWGVVRSSGRVLPVKDGLQSVTYLGYATTDQPDDGTGTYTEITAGIHLRGGFGDGWPSTRIELDSTADGYLPTSGYNVIKVTGPWGPVSVRPRIRELATIAVVRAFRARSDGRGSPDIAVVGPDGGLTVLRRIAPAEMAELIRDYAADTRPAFQSVSTR